MKRLFSYIDLVLWTIVLFIGLLTLAKEGQIPSFMAVVAILLCFLDRFVRVIQNQEITVEVTTNINKHAESEDVNERQD